MKRILIVLAGVNLLLLLLAGSAVGMAELAPFGADSPLYHAQLQAEDWRLGLTPSPTAQADWAMQLIDRRLQDLALASTLDQTQLSLEAFQKNLEDALELAAMLPEMERVQASTSIETLLKQAKIVLAGLPEAAQATPLIERLEALLAAGTPEQRAAIMAMPIEAAAVPFLDRNIDHSFFPLVGGHNNLECETCHMSGEYADLATTCEACHRYVPKQAWLIYDANRGMRPDDIDFTNPYNQHFAGACSDCHGIYTWEPYDFDHREVVECASCHHNDLPQSEGLINSLFLVNYSPRPDQESSHYPGECSICHSDVTDWQVAEYSHTEPLACGSCHEADAPEEHYAGECANCHIDTDAWAVIAFDHTSFPACTSCHAEDTPNSHYTGRCSNCHVTGAWEIIFFNHSGLSDCKTCHQDDAPVNHYSGQCSGCHTTISWKQTLFDHDLFGSCQTCHNTPTAHYPGICANCHNGSSWSIINYNHQGAADCTTCHQSVTPTDHYVGSCNLCHGIASWASASYTHTGTETCTDCHKGVDPVTHYPQLTCHECHCTCQWTPLIFTHDTDVACIACHASPDDHYGDDCSACHATDDWADYDFDHAGFNNCVTCHASPEGHWPGSCGNCHETTDWVTMHFDHTGYTNCRACHADERPAGHERGQCSRCHSTTSWFIATPTPLPTDPPAINWPSVIYPTPAPDIFATPTPSGFPTPAPDIIP